MNRWSFSCLLILFVLLLCALLAGMVPMVLLPISTGS